MGRRTPWTTYLALGLGAQGVIALMRPMPAVPPVAALPATPPAASAAEAVPAAASVSGSCGDVSMPAIRAVIREQESGGDYAAQAAGSSASGAYQFIDETWNHFGGFARAVHAPPAIQDAKATEHILDAMGGTGDVSRIPVVWYIGHIPNEGEWDVVPAPWAGNTITPRQYRDRWMARYAKACGEVS